MNVNQLLLKKKNSKYRFSQISGIPYSTVNDICSGKTKMRKCSGETLYKLAKALDTPMEKLIEAEMSNEGIGLENRVDFDIFKSNVCQRVREIGDMDFIVEVIESQEVRELFERKWYRESFYLLAMLDHLSKENDVPICEDYNDIRNCKMLDSDLGGFI